MSKIPLPHEGVYTRIRPSALSGVGVFAIRDIPKGTSVFGNDDSPTVSIDALAIDSLPPAIKKLYEDFCVLQGDKYECPVSFNDLTPSWYLNHSSEPNVAPDSELRFYATRDISCGEELTSDYDSYSENESALKPETQS
jgi:hypothetical protein